MTKAIYHLFKSLSLVFVCLFISLSALGESVDSIAAPLSDEKPKSLASKLAIGAGFDADTQVGTRVGLYLARMKASEGGSQFNYLGFEASRRGYGVQAGRSLYSYFFGGINGSLGVFRDEKEPLKGNPQFYFAPRVSLVLTMIQIGFGVLVGKDATYGEAYFGTTIPLYF